MKQVALEQHIKAAVLDKTLRDAQFRKRIEQGLVDAHPKVFLPDRPLYKSYPAGTYWHHAAKHVHGYVRELGFTYLPEKNQHQLLASSISYECPVRLRFAQGIIENKVAFLSADKGRMTRKGISQNHRHFRTQPLFSPEFSLYNYQPERELNLWVIYKIQPKFITAWLGLCTEWENPKKFPCDEAELICSKPMGATDIDLPVVLPRIDDGGYDMSLEDKPTGS